MKIQTVSRNYHLFLRPYLLAHIIWCLRTRVKRDARHLAGLFAQSLPKKPILLIPLKQPVPDRQRRFNLPAFGFQTLQVFV